jgi:selenocysteine-specific elongation factor
LDEGDPPTVVRSLAAAQPKRAVDLRELNSMLGMPEAELETICDGLAAAQKLLRVPAPVPIYLLPEITRSLEEETLSLVSEFHEQNPLQKGVSREELRNRVYGDLPLEIFRYMLDRLVEKKKIALQEEVVCLHGREIQLSRHEEALREMIETIYRQSGCQPPAVSDLPAALGQDAAEVRKVYFWMLKQKLLVKVSEELTWHRLAIDEIKQKIRSTFKSGDKFGVADFKDLFSMTRKHAIPLLEYLDRERVTRRQGNDRILL